LDAKQEIEDAIGSLGKIKIIKTLAEENKLATVYLLHKKTHLKRDDIKNNLKDLVSIGWVLQNKYGNVMYSVNKENSHARMFIDYLKEVGYIQQFE
jgi:hypothetical protein